MVKRIMVGAHYGLRDWVVQRVTAVYMALFAVFFALKACTVPSLDYENWTALFSGGFIRFTTFLFFMAVFYHAWIGIRDVIMDYVQCTVAKVTLYSIVIFLLVGYAGWTALVLWRL